MPIVKNPKRKSEQKAKAFINNNNGADRTTGRQLKSMPVLVHFDAALLEKATKAAPTMGLNRAAFICMCVAEKLRRMDSE